MPEMNVAKQLFDPDQIRKMKEAASMAEELVYNYYKLPSGRKNNPRYDVLTRCQFVSEEIPEGPFAQVVRYEAKPKSSPLGSMTFDFYKICLDDTAILKELVLFPHLELFPVVLYLVTHELVHVVRFTKFLQNFNAVHEQKLIEEKRVHEITQAILSPVNVPGLSQVLAHSEKWLTSLDSMLNGSDGGQPEKNCSPPA